MFEAIQSRTLAVSGAALPTFGFDPAPVLVPVKLAGHEALGELFTYTLTCRTSDALAFQPSIGANVPLDKIVGTEVTVSIEILGKGTFVAGLPGNTGMDNVGAGTREITGVVECARLVREEARGFLYEFTLRPWLWVATRNQDTRYFQDANVLEITDAVLARYAYPVDKRLFGPAPNVPYPKRDLVRQHRESDWAFLQRLWEEWGISYHFEHSGGHCRLVLTDGNAAFQPHGAAYETVRYQSPQGKRIDEEHIDALTVASSLTTGKVTLTDYDYTQPRADLRTEDEDPRDTAHAHQEEYGWGDYAQPLAGATGLTGEHNDALREGQYLARARMEALRAAGLRATGSGDLRGLEPGRTFKLVEYPQRAANRDYLVVSCALEIEEVAEATGAGHRYRCEARFALQPANTPFRLPRTVPKPVMSGTEYAIVTGPQDQEIWTDAYGRIKLQFLWDRLGQRDQASSTWTRVSTHWQGNQMGATHLPRIGQEVLVGFINGDPDLPIVVGSAVNAYNLPGYALPHNQALAAHRSKEIGGTRANTLAFDDTTGKIGTHLGSDEGASHLSLGTITRIAGNAGRQDERGRGFELRTNLWGVMRAAMGLFITTEGRADAQGQVKDAKEAIGRLTQARDLQESLTDLAQRYGAQQKNADQSDVTQAIKAQNDAIKGGMPSEGNAFPQFEAPHLTLDSPAGVQVSTAGSAHLAADQHLAVTTGAHVAVAAGKSFFASVADAFVLFVHKLGIKLVAAAGKVRIEAQSDEMELIAERVLRLMSTKDWVEILAKQGIRLNGGGSVVEISPEGVFVYTKGQHLVHAADHQGLGPMNKPLAFPGRPTEFCERCFRMAAQSGSAIVPQ